MRHLWLVIAVLGCKDKPRHKEKEIDAAVFRHMLEDRAESVGIESIRIEPGDHADARYDLTLKTTGVHSVVVAEYPGTIIDAIVAAGVPYLVGDPGERASNEKLIDMTSLRAELGAETASDIERIEIAPLDHDRARYTIVHKGSRAREVSYGEYPSKLTLEVERAHIPSSVTAR